MPSSSHHVCCVTTDAEGVLRLLTEVVGLAELSSFTVDGATATALLGWPPSDGFDAWMMGSGSRGLVEVIQVPPSLVGEVATGLVLTSFASRDLDDAAAKATAAGFTPSDRVEIREPGAELDAFVVDHGGVRFEFSSFVGGSAAVPLAPKPGTA